MLEAQRLGLARKPVGEGEAQVRERLSERMWEPFNLSVHSRMQNV